MFSERKSFNVERNENLLKLKAKIEETTLL